MRVWCEEGGKHSWHWLQTPPDASSYKHYPTEIPGKRKIWIQHTKKHEKNNWNWRNLEKLAWLIASASLSAQQKVSFITSRLFFYVFFSFYVDNTNRNSAKKEILISSVLCGFSFALVCVRPCDRFVGISPIWWKSPFSFSFFSLTAI